VVIVNFNTGAVLKDAVASVLRSPQVAQIYIIDNASTDASLDSLAEVQDHRVTVFRNSANLGFAAACNIGLARTTAENVLLLNPDAEMMGAAVECLMAALRSADNVGMAGPLLLNPDGSEQAGGRRMFPTPKTVLAEMVNSTWLKRFASAPALHRNPLPRDPTAIEAISGACMAVRRDALTAVGLLDERYYLHCEDLDWCMRFRQQGWAILFVPDAKVVHHKGVSSKYNPLRVEYYKHRGIIQFYWKFSTDAGHRLLVIPVFVCVWLRFAAVMASRLLSRKG
jgi:hypothetical protein